MLEVRNEARAKRQMGSVVVHAFYIRFLAKTLLSVMFLLTVAGLAPARAQQSGSYANRTLKAVRVPDGAKLPVIDGDLADTVWKLAARADGFVDPDSGKPFSDQTEVFLLFDTQFIYIAFYCHDSRPEGIVARETVRDANMRAEDLMRITIDPYLTRKFDDYAEFDVNAIGTRATHIGGGRAGKVEWQGDWTAAVKRVSDGWTGEVRIPWAILNYPNRRGPGNMGINFRRWHERLKVETMWSDLGPQRFNERDGTWQQVEAPQRAWKPRLSALPYIEPISSTSRRLGEVRAGLDLRYQPTSDLTMVGTVTPDFASVEGAVESIAFSRSERYVPERRPFFLEGQGALTLGEDYQIGQYFDSHHISKVDAGFKLFGKLNADSTLGVLGTVGFGKEANYVTRFRRDFGSTATGTAMLIQHLERGADNTVLVLAQDGRRGKWGIDSQFAASGGPNAGGNAWTAAANLSDKNLFSTLRWNDVGTNFTDRLGLIGFNDYKGISSFTDWNANWKHGYLRSFDAFLNPVWNWHQNGAPFQRNISFGGQIETRSDYRLGINAYGGKFDDQMDILVGASIEGGVSNRFRKWGVSFSTGKQADLPYTSFGPTLSLRLFRRLDVSIASFIQNYQGVDHQEIVTFNYERSPTRAWGGRAVIQNGNVNFYVSYRNAGRAGTDTYVVIGDPNARRFTSQVLVKWVLAI